MQRTTPSPLSLFFFIPSAYPTHPFPLSTIQTLCRPQLWLFFIAQLIDHYIKERNFKHIRFEEFTTVMCEKLLLIGMNIARYPAMKAIIARNYNEATINKHKKEISMKKILGLPMLAGMLILTSCGTCKKQSMNNDVTGTWTIVEAMGQSTAQGDSEAVITFEAEGKLTGNSSVNSFFGDYTFKTGTLSFSNVGLTRRMGRSMDVEACVIQAVNNSTAISVDGSNAVITDKNGKTIMKLRKK